MAHEHPFQHLFETLGSQPAASAESVNREAGETLAGILTVPVERSGRCILLRAPRAGHGKTHLLSRIRHKLGASHEFIPLRAAFGCRIDAATVMDDTLRQLFREIPAAGGLTTLDLVTRRLFSAALQPLVISGDVPCQDRDGALASLRTRPVETFDFHHANAVTAHWAAENFDVLGQRLATELANRAGLPLCDVEFWVSALFVFASTPPEQSDRIRSFRENAHAAAAGEMDHLSALLGLLCQLDRVVLVADDLEGFSGDDSAALRLAAFLGALRQSVDRLDVILSVNQDIWQKAFMPRLSEGLADRLSEVVVELEPLKDEEIAELLDSRVPGLGRRVRGEIDVGKSGRHARGLIRAAGLAWLKATAMDSAPPAGQEAEEIPEPMETPLPVPGADFMLPTEDFTMPAEDFGPPAPWPTPDFSGMPEPWQDEPAVWQVPDFSGKSGEWETPAAGKKDGTESTTFSTAPDDFETWKPLTPPPVPDSAKSPFTISPQVTAPPEPTAEIFTSAGWQPTPQEADPHVPEPVESAAAPELPTPPPDSPFQIAPPEIPPQPDAAGEPEIPQPPPVGADRVDELLRQFRERYGRGSL